MLYLINPASAVGRCAVVPLGYFKEPVPVIFTFPVAGDIVKSPVDDIVASLKVNVSIVTAPVPLPLNSKSAFVLEVVITLSYYVSI